MFMLTKDDVRTSAGGWWMLPTVSVIMDEAGMNWVQEHLEIRNFNVKFFPWTDIIVWCGCPALVSAASRVWMILTPHAMQPGLQGGMQRRSTGGTDHAPRHEGRAALLHTAFPAHLSLGVHRPNIRGSPEGLRSRTGSRSHAIYRSLGVYQA